MSIHSIKNLLGTGKPLLLDGGLGTTLETYGGLLHESLWGSGMLLENEQLILQIHEEFVRAGADIISTASYQLTPQRLSELGCSQWKTEALFKLAVCLARKAVVGSTAVVAASIGPYGAYLGDGSEYTGNYKLSVEELMDFHKERIRLLIMNKPDLLVFETIPDANEAEAITRLMKPEEIPYWISMSCKSPGVWASGESCEDFLSQTAHLNTLVAVGVNCCHPEAVLDQMKYLSDKMEKPIVVYPNSGMAWNAENKTWVGDEDDKQFAETAQSWLDAGAAIIGGCCNVSPPGVQKIRQAIDDWI